MCTCVRPKASDPLELEFQVAVADENARHRTRGLWEDYFKLVTAELTLESSFLEPRFLWENSYGKKIARYLVSQLDDCIEATPKGEIVFLTHVSVLPSLLLSLVGY